jgi:hypothetical protein
VKFVQSNAAIAAICAVAFFPAIAKADVGTIIASNSEAWASVGAESLNYKEAVSPVPDADRGVVPSFAAGVDYMTDSGLYLAGQATASFGGAGYFGATVDYPGAPEVPYEGNTHERIITIDGKIGQGFVLGPSAMITPYGDLGFRYWRRNLGDGDTEEYHHLAALAGGMLQFSPTNRLVFTGYGAAGVTFGTHMRDSYGINYSLGPAGIFEVGGKIGYDLTQRWELFTSLDFEHFRYVQSPQEADPVDSAIYDEPVTAQEPGSFTNETSMRLGIAYHLK